MEGTGVVGPACGSAALGAICRVTGNVSAFVRVRGVAPLLRREGPPTGKCAAANSPRPDDLVWVKIEWGERELAGRVKAAGDRWTPGRKLWELPWARVVELGLEFRVEGKVGFQK